MAAVTDSCDDGDADGAGGEVGASAAVGGGGGELERLTSKFKSKDVWDGRLGFLGPSMGRQGGKILMPSNGDDDDDARDDDGRDGSVPSFKESHPVDIDIALDNMLGREFADRLNEWLSSRGKERTHVGVVLKNPEKSKHLETATVKVGDYWIDFVNLRAEEYAENSRIPDLMRIGTAEEDAHRRDLTINSLFYNVNTGRVEDWTGRGFDDLRRGVVATPLPPLTTLLDDPLRVLRSVRFAARLRFAMDGPLRSAAKDPRVRTALAVKVARERIGSEVDLMLRSRDPVGALRLLLNLRLAGTVFPIGTSVTDPKDRSLVFARGLSLLSATHDHLLDCRSSPPGWCDRDRSRDSVTYGASERVLMDDEEARRLLWYAAFLKPLRDQVSAESGRDGARYGGRARGRKANRGVVTSLLVDELKRPLRDAEAVQRIIEGADGFTRLLEGGVGGRLSSRAILLGEVRVRHERERRVRHEPAASASVVGDDQDSADDADDDQGEGTSSFVSRNGDRYEVSCSMLRRGDTWSTSVSCENETDPFWRAAMEFRLQASSILGRVGPLWRAALILSLSERLAGLEDDDNEIAYAVEGDYVSSLLPQLSPLPSFSLSLS